MGGGGALGAEGIPVGRERALGEGGE